MVGIRNLNDGPFFKIEFENKTDMERAIFEITNIDKSGNGWDTICGVNRLLVNMEQIDFLLKRRLQFIILDFKKKNRDCLLD